MRLLLDTHTLLWWLLTPGQLSAGAHAAITAPDVAVFVSAASAWEAAIKRALGKLDVPDDLETQIAAAGFTPLSITLAHGTAAGALPLHHRDPFDRLLIAQARAERLTLVTRDAALAVYGIETLAA